MDCREAVRRGQSLKIAKNVGSGGNGPGQDRSRDLDRKCDREDICCASCQRLPFLMMDRTLAVDAEIIQLRERAVLPKSEALDRLGFVRICAKARPRHCEVSGG